MSDNYIVMIVTLTVWLGLFLFIWRVDKRLRELEKRHTPPK